MSTISKINPAFTLDRIRFEAEGQYFDRKSRDTKASKLANLMISFLNANGGVVAFGIGNDGTIEDLNDLPPEKLDLYRKIVNDYIQPPADVELEEIKLEYNKPIRSFEDELRPDFDPADLRKTVCEYYREKMRFEGTFEELAVKRNLAARRDGGLVYKNAAILLFANDPTQYIPNASVRYVRYSGTERRSGSEFNVIKDERFEECLPRLVELLDRFVHATLRDYYYLDIEDGKFQRIPEYPKEA